jgi:glycerol-3-phosphate acyltransferase PlsY
MTAMFFTEIILIIAAYLLGSVSTAVIVARLGGNPDPRDVGSRNPGATNVYRTAGKRAAGVTLLGDILKGVIPVLVAHWAALGPLAISLVALAALLGHCYPVFFQFKGGKGVATAFGALLTVEWTIGLSLLLVWLVVFTLTRISSLSAIIASLTVPISAYYSQTESILVLNIIALIVVWRHYGNILNLFHGDESGFRKSKDDNQMSD